MNDLTRPTVLSLRQKFFLSAGLLSASLLAWVTSLLLADGMPPGMAEFVLIWTVMMAAMMLPSVLPTVLLFATVSRSRTQLGFRPAPTVVFVTGYLGAWMLTGVAAGGFTQVSEAALLLPRSMLVGGALSLGGLYQLTRWKARCLGHCRTPLHFFMEQWRDGALGALGMGAHHGLYCVACCWGLMLALLALGMMSPAWMGLITLLIAVEKIAPRGEQVALAGGVLGILLGSAIALGWLSLPPMTGGM
jgi:predicted metal-binding membrane protein